MSIQKYTCSIFIVCDRGFRGEKCDIKCPYPTYGEDCQSECNCNVTYCDHVSGCTESSEGKIHYKKEQYIVNLELKYIIHNMSRYFNIFKLRRYEYINQIIFVNPALFFVPYSFEVHFFKLLIRGNSVCKILKALFSIYKRKVFSFKEDFSKHLSYKAVTKDLINKIITVKSK